MFYSLSRHWKRILQECEDKTDVYVLSIESGVSHSLAV